MLKEELIINFYNCYDLMASKVNKSSQKPFLFAIGETLKALNRAKEYLNELDSYAVYNALLIARVIIRRKEEGKISDYYRIELLHILENYEKLKDLVVTKKENRRI